MTQTLEREVELNKSSEHILKRCGNTFCTKQLPAKPFVSQYGGEYCTEECYKIADQYEFD